METTLKQCDQAKEKLEQAKKAEHEGLHILDKAIEDKKPDWLIGICAQAWYSYRQEIKRLQKIYRATVVLNPNYCPRCASICTDYHDIVYHMQTFGDPKDPTKEEAEAILKDVAL